MVKKCGIIIMYIENFITRMFEDTDRVIRFLIPLNDVLIDKHYNCGTMTGNNDWQV